MPEQVLGTRTTDRTASQAHNYIVEEFGSSGMDIAEDVAIFGLGQVVERLTDVLIKEIWGYGSMFFDLAEFESRVNRLQLERDANTVLNKMIVLLEQGKPAGKMRITEERRRWVSSNGNQYSGEYYVPIKFQHVS